MKARELQEDLQICLSSCCPHPWIGPLSFGTQRVRSKMSLSLLSRAVRSMFMMSSGHQFTLLSSLKLMEMDSLIFGTSIETQRAQLLVRRHLRLPTLELTKTLTTLRHLVPLSGQKTEDNSLLETQMDLLVSGKLTRSFTCQSNLTLISLRSLSRTTRLKLHNNNDYYW